MKRLLFALLLLLIIAHQDYWAWDRVDPLILGFMPVGLAWHVGVSMAAALTWLLAVRCCWPGELADPDVAAPLRSTEDQRA